MMGRLLSITAFVVICAATLNGSSAQGPPENNLPIHSISENLPCADQPKSLKELTNAFASGRLPAPSDMTGTWVAISNFIATDESTMNCSGLRRGAKLFEEVMIANGYSLEMHVVGG